MSSLAMRVARGAALLDRHCPGWEQALNLSRLALEKEDCCILAQLFGSYAKGRRAVRLGLPFCLAGRSPARYGFHAGICAGERAWHPLNVAWLEEIKKRRAAPRAALFYPEERRCPSDPFLLESRRHRTLHKEHIRMELTPLTALSSLDGRYRRTGEKLVPYFSELALIKYRVEREVDYLLALCEEPRLPLEPLTDEEKRVLDALRGLSLEDAVLIKSIETVGWGSVKRTNHDVQAVVVYLRERLRERGLERLVEWVHFGLTSEDINNTAYALMLRDAVCEVLYPAIRDIAEHLNEFARTHAALPMLARTHGQAATPTTLGKEAKVFAKRLERQLEALQDFTLLAKLNGASGNYSAMVAAFPEVDWEAFSVKFIAELNDCEPSDAFLLIEHNAHTTQIEPHDTYAELFGIFMRVNAILVDLCQDEWRYISDDWLVQRPVEGEVGSSAMPHKVNPIDFENAEGKLLGANAQFEFFARKLPVSRLQRDLSDSTVERDFGEAFGKSLVGYESIRRGLAKVSADTQKIAEALNAHPEVVSEALQTILRAEGLPGAYDQLKGFTRGQHPTLGEMHAFIDSLDVEERVRERLRAIRPENYLGLAPKLARGEEAASKKPPAPPPRPALLF